MPSPRTLSKLSASELRIVGEAALMLPLTAAGLRIVGLQAWKGLLTRTSGRTPAPRQPMAHQAQAVARTVGRVVRRFPYRPSCLHHSIVLWWLLRRRGISSSVEVGVRRESESLHAHAWVVCENVVLNDHDDVGQRFSRFENIPQR
jgi:hypothetical protein